VPVIDISPAAIARREAARMTNRELSLRLGYINDNPRKFSKHQRNAALSVAAQRLFWKEDYDNHVS
jgi:hypothetical protein